MATDRATDARQKEADTRAAPAQRTESKSGQKPGTEVTSVVRGLARAVAELREPGELAGHFVTAAAVLHALGGSGASEPSAVADLQQAWAEAGERMAELPGNGSPDRVQAVATVSRWSDEAWDALDACASDTTSGAKG